MAWKQNPDRYPLLIRGARQVGKSFLVDSFGAEAFRQVITLNFEFKPQFKTCFASLDPHDIINKIQLLLNLHIDPDTTLLFLDEIQDCPQAIMALRYFREKMPRLAVVGAGSLLEFALRNADMRMPVGRVHFLHVEPFSFAEFLDAIGQAQLRDYLAAVDLHTPIAEPIHDKLLELVRLYVIIGGMPAVLKAYLETHNFLTCATLQTGLLQTYRSDFGKYAKLAQHKYLQCVFEAVPRLVGQRVKYSHMDRDAKSRDLKQAVELLALAGVINPIYASKASGLPLGAQLDQQRFKLNFLDVGLMQNACGLQAELSAQQDVTQINSGAVAEQFVGQELRATTDPYRDRQLFFWARDKPGGNAEVDYVIAIDSTIFPIEVKAGKTGTLKSLKQFLSEKPVPFGIRVSQEGLSYHDRVLSVPFYLVGQVPRLVRQVAL